MPQQFVGYLGEVTDLARRRHADICSIAGLRLRVRVDVNASRLNGRSSWCGSCGEGVALALYRWPGELHRSPDWAYAISLHGEAGPSAVSQRCGPRRPICLSQLAPHHALGCCVHRVKPEAGRPEQFRIGRAPLDISTFQEDALSQRARQARTPAPQRFKKGCVHQRHRARRQPGGLLSQMSITPRPARAVCQRGRATCSLCRG